MPDLAQFFAEQREKYQKQREDAKAKLDEAEAELRALDAYERAKKGKPAQTAGEHKTRKPRETGKRAEVLNLVASYPDGVTAGELKDKLGIKGDKSAEQSLSNALSALKKAGQLALRDGRYAVPAPA